MPMSFGVLKVENDHCSQYFRRFLHFSDLPVPPTLLPCCGEIGSSQAELCWCVQTTQGPRFTKRTYSKNELRYPENEVDYSQML